MQQTASQQALVNPPLALVKTTSFCLGTAHYRMVPQVHAGWEDVWFAHQVRSKAVW
jgi:hypothetical protein